MKNHIKVGCVGINQNEVYEGSRLKEEEEDGFSFEMDEGDSPR